MSTRWNFTYLILESAIKYKKAFASLQLIDKNYKFCPTSLEWTRGEKIYEFLEPFYETTNLISGSSYPTSNLYFMQVWKIECLLLENERNKDVVISGMCKRIKYKFDKYWSQYSVVLAFRVVLDPHIKLTMLEHFYSKIDVSKAKDTVKEVRTNLNKLFKQYANPTNASSSSSQSPSISHAYMPMSIGGLIGNKGKKILDVSVSSCALFYIFFIFIFVLLIIYLTCVWNWCRKLKYLRAKLLQMLENPNWISTWRSRNLSLNSMKNWMYCTIRRVISIGFQFFQ